MADHRTVQLAEKARSLALKWQLLTGNPTLKKFGYLTYCAGAVVAAFFRSSIGTPVALQLKNHLVTILAHIEMFWTSLLSHGGTISAQLNLVFRSLTVPVHAAWTQIARVLGTLAGGL